MGSLAVRDRHDAPAVGLGQAGLDTFEDQLLRRSAGVDVLV